MAKMSKKMPLKVFAAKYRFNPKEEQWILDNDKDDHYYNNSALKNAWSSLSYPIYDGDYYFAFIHDKPRVNAQYNAKANRELRKYITSTLNADEIYDKMEKYFSMQFKDAGAGDTMTREELWTAIVDMRQKNPVKEELEEIALGPNMLRKDFPNVWATKDAKLYRVLANLISFDGFVDNAKAYKKNPKTFIDGLRKIAKNPQKYAKYYGKNFPQYINNPKPNQNFAKLPESINEVTDKEINMAKKLSKDMEKIKKGYQQIAKTGDKTLKSTGFNATYESILKAQQKVLSLIGELTTMKQISDRGASRKKDAQGRPIMSSNIMDSYKEMREDELKEESITYELKVKNKNGPEYKKFEKSARMMKLKMSSKMNAGNKMVAIVDGTKKNLRDFDSVVRGRQSYGDPSTIKHFDEK